MRGAIRVILAGAALALSSTAANAALTVITCDPTISGGFTAAHPAAPAPAPISWAGADVGLSPVTRVLPFNNKMAGDYFLFLSTSYPLFLFLALTKKPLTPSRN